MECGAGVVVSSNVTSKEISFRNTSVVVISRIFCLLDILRAPMAGTYGGLRWPLFLMIPCRILAELPADSLGAYVISMARTASDVLAVVLLQRECGVKDILRVAPLFETLDDLTNAPGTIKTLFSNEWYLKHIKGSQECMIGERTSLSLKELKEITVRVPL